MSETSALVEQNKPQGANALMEVEQSRAVQEVQAALVIAKKFPRNHAQAYANIMLACTRKTLAESAIYVYPRGSKKVEGPSIRLAEALAQNWGNLQFGVRELSQENGFSEVEAYAWDMETNTRQVKTFRVRHWRDTKQGGYALTDARDIYEKVANDGARRLRACILGVIPGDVVDEAVAECRKTLISAEKEPLDKRIMKMVAAFQTQWNVSKEMIEKYLGHNSDSINETEMVTLKGVFKSLKDGMSSVENHFEQGSGAVSSGGGPPPQSAPVEPSSTAPAPTPDGLDDPPGTPVETSQGQRGPLPYDLPPKGDDLRLDFVAWVDIQVQAGCLEDAWKLKQEDWKGRCRGKQGGMLFAIYKKALDAMEPEGQPQRPEGADEYYESGDIPFR